jgi:cytochrome P450
MTVLVRAADEGEQPSRGELIAMTLLIALAGHDT